MKWRSLAAVVVGVGLMISACTPGNRTAENLDRGAVASDSAQNFLRAAYDATDRLVQTSQAALSPGKPLLITSLVDINDYDASSAFGRLIREKVMSRLVNAGYSVVEVTLRNNLLVRRGGGQFMLSRNVRNIGQSRGAQAVIAGTYAVAKKDVFVNLRLIRADDGHILSSVDFAVPLDGNVASLVPPPTAYISSGN